MFRAQRSGWFAFLSRLRRSACADWSSSCCAFSLKLLTEDGLFLQATTLILYCAVMMLWYPQSTASRPPLPSRRGCCSSCSAALIAAAPIGTAEHNDVHVLRVQSVAAIRTLSFPHRPRPAHHPWPPPSHCRIHAFELDRPGRMSLSVTGAWTCVLHAISSLMSHPTVVSVDLLPHLLLHNRNSSLLLANAENTASLANDDLSWLPALGLDGSGEVVALADSGIDWDHCAFAPDLPLPLNTFNNSKQKIIAYFSAGMPSAGDFARACTQRCGSGDASDDLEGHGTHVAGTAAGRAPASSSYSPYNSMAAAARIVFTGHTGVVRQPDYPRRSVQRHISRRVCCRRAHPQQQLGLRPGTRRPCDALQRVRRYGSGHRPFRLGARRLCGSCGCRQRRNFWRGHRRRSCHLQELHHCRLVRRILESGVSYECKPPASWTRPAQQHGGVLKLRLHPA